MPSLPIYQLPDAEHLLGQIPIFANRFQSADLLHKQLLHKQAVRSQETFLITASWGVSTAPFQLQTVFKERTRVSTWMNCCCTRGQKKRLCGEQRRLLWRDVVSWCIECKLENEPVSVSWGRAIFILLPFSPGRRLGNCFNELEREKGDANG